MSNHSVDYAHSAGQTPNGSVSADADWGIHWPRLYDLLLHFLTRGRGHAYREAVLDLARIVPGDRVLDIGCGTGTQAIAAHRRSQPGGSVIGIDIAPNMLKVASRKARRAGCDIPFRIASAAALPFEDGYFDVVTVTTVMHMVPESMRRLCLHEAARVLRAGGRLVLVDYAGDPHKRTGLVAKHGAHGRFDLDQLRAAMTEAGFTDVESGPLGWMSLHFLRGRVLS